MNAKELRRAVDYLTKELPGWADSSGVMEVGMEPVTAVWEAARTIALPILEADRELIERIAGELCNHIDKDGTPAPCDEHMNTVRAVFAAIATL